MWILVHIQLKGYTSSNIHQWFIYIAQSIPGWSSHIVLLHVHPVNCTSVIITCIYVTQRPSTRTSIHTYWTVQACPARIACTQVRKNASAILTQRFTGHVLNGSQIELHKFFSCMEVIIIIKCTIKVLCKIRHNNDIPHLVIYHWPTGKLDMDSYLWWQCNSYIYMVSHMQFCITCDFLRGFEDIAPPPPV